METREAELRLFSAVDSAARLYNGGERRWWTLVDMVMPELDQSYVHNNHNAAVAHCESLIQERIDDMRTIDDQPRCY